MVYKTEFLLINNTYKMTDQEIIKEIRYGNITSSERALKYMYASFYSMTEHMILKNSGIKADAKDVFQDAMIVFYNKIKQDDFKLNSKISTFLYAISRNIWLKKLRDNKKSTNNLSIEDLHLIGTDDIQMVLEFSENQIILGDLLEKSGPKCVALLKAFYFEKLRIRKIAELQNYSSEQVVKNQKSRCIKKIKTLLMKNKNYRESLSTQ